jgi:hypothetical protein
MEFPRKLFFWACFGVGVSVVCVAWRPIVGEVSWTVAIEHGELVLIAVTLIASAVGYAAIAQVDGGAEAVRSVVIGLGIIVLLLSMAVFVGMSKASGSIDHKRVAGDSYALLAVSVLLGSLSTYVSHRSE